MIPIQICYTWYVLIHVSSILQRELGEPELNWTTGSHFFRFSFFAFLVEALTRNTQHTQSIFRFTICPNALELLPAVDRRPWQNYLSPKELEKKCNPSAFSTRSCRLAPCPMVRFGGNGWWSCPRVDELYLSACAEQAGGLQDGHLERTHGGVRVRGVCEGAKISFRPFQFFLSVILLVFCRFFSCFLHILFFLISLAECSSLFCNHGPKALVQLHEHFWGQLLGSSCGRIFAAAKGNIGGGFI